MNKAWGELPPPARAIATAAAEAVSAAQATDLGAFQAATAQLAGLDPEQVGLVLGAVVRSLLEDLHPDGLSGEDVRAVLVRCVAGAVAWSPDVDANAVLVLLTSALGIHPAAEEAPLPSGPAVARHAPLLVADLLTTSGRALTGYLHGAFAEIARAETMELP